MELGPLPRSLFHALQLTSVRKHLSDAQLIAIRLPSGTTVSACWSAVCVDHLFISFGSTPNGN